MEREQPIQRAAAPGGSGAGDNSLDPINDRLAGLLDAADRILDTIRPVNAEEYLQQNRQRGGE
ncbi:MAG: hypothetical protein K2R98_34030 [Gemmataceae bacterium]|nr:hypothetical protein [Gemmataceae bacterium]